MEINSKQKQLYYSGVLGDGHLLSSGGIRYSSIEKEYMEYKKEIFEGVESGEIRSNLNLGYKNNIIHSFHVSANKFGKNLLNTSIEDIVNRLDDYGITIWFLDDGSLHKKTHFYNLCTHSFSKEFQEDVIIPRLNKHGIYPKVMVERKQDGRKFHYLYIKKYSGAMDISENINKIGLDCYKYKTIPEHVIRNKEVMSKKFNGSKVSIFTLSRIINLENPKEFYEWMDKAIVRKDGILVFSKNYNKISVDESKYITL